MVEPTDPLRADLIRLRKGWGLRGRDPERIGPALRDLLPKTWNGATFEELRTLLELHLEGLPHEHRLLIRGAFGLSTEIDDRTLDGRVQHLAGLLGITAKTVLRRLDQAQTLLIESLRTDPISEPVWEFVKFQALLRLDTERPEAVERRSLQVLSGTLTEIDTSISIPRHTDSTTHGLEAELHFGGRLRLGESKFPTQFHHIVELDEPLTAGGRHSYGLGMRLPAGQTMSPHYVYVPHRPCRTFELIVRFDVDHLPRSVWRLDGPSSAVIYENEPSDELLVPSRSGEVRASFAAPAVGRSYGLCWSW